ncbi:MAG: alkaline phosphatase family protein [Anaerolineales bacterium]|nr:alkaline phosphatase family protein [Anaerolineales bacterium]
MRTLNKIWILAFLLLQSCGTPAPAAPTLVPPPTETLVPNTALPATPTFPPAFTATPAPQVSRVLIVSFDGLRPDLIQKAQMQNVQALMQNGAYTLAAQTIMPSTTLPSHASMLVGTCPAKHIVRWDLYVPENGYALGTDLFDLAHAAGMRTVMVVGKEKLRQITEPASLDYFAFVDSTDKVDDPLSIAQLANRQISEGFSLMFVHFPDGDLKGHDYGWGSRKQLEAFETEDENFGYILQTLKNKSMYESTLILISADHGGHDTTHGYNTPEDRTIPWIASGPGILPRQLTTPVHTMDTAATAAFALGLPIPVEWDGVPVDEAFGLPASASENCN